MVEMAKEVSRAEFYALFETEAPTIASFTVGFALVRRRDREEEAYLGGSGTLVTVDDRKGILTAEHVLRNLLENNGPIGLILTKYGRSPIHRLFFTPKRDECTLFPNPDDDASGPDLGFVPLDQEISDAISARKSFYNLTSRRGRMLDQPPGSHLGAWYISGTPSEWTRDGQAAGGFEKVKEFRGMIGEVRPSRSLMRDEFDYEVVDALVGQAPEWPGDYEGYSGSGVWQILVKETDGKLAIAERLLSGVAFYQSDILTKDDKRVRELTCHGRRSIYGRLIDAVRSAGGAGA